MRWYRHGPLRGRMDANEGRYRRGIQWLSYQRRRISVGDTPLFLFVWVMISGERFFVFVFAEAASTAGKRAVQ